MITYEEVKRLIRFKEKDNNEIKFSDYEIRLSVNEVIRYLNNSYALQNSDFLEKVTSYNETEYYEDAEPKEDGTLYSFKVDGIDLPEDYITLVSIQRTRDGYIMYPIESIKTPDDGQYKIVGDKLYSGNPSIKMLYKAAIAEVVNDTDGIELPFVFKDTIVKLSCMVLNNAQTDILMQAVNDAVMAIVPRRRYRNARIRMPFKV